MAKQDEKDAEQQKADDELAARRARQAEKERAEEAAVQGKSLEDLEAEGGIAEEEGDGQFSLEIPTTGRKITLGTMVPRGTPVEVKYKMSGKSIPNVKGGLPDPADTNGLLLVSFVVEDVDTKFTRDGDGKIEKATIYVVLAPKHVVNARSEAGATLLHGEQAA